MKRYTKKCAIWHAKNFAKSFGFTLAELLVSTLIISIIMVVLAPVITKRVTSNINVSGSGGGSGSSKQDNKLFVYNPTDPDCIPVAGQRSLDCGFRTGSGVKSVNVVMVSGGGGGAGATTPNYDYGKKLTVTNSTIGSAKTQEFTITKGMKNFTVTYLAGSGGGGGGGTWSESAGGAPTSQADCDPYGAKFLTAAQNNGKAVCVTKFNIGDIPSAPNGGIAASVTTVSTNTYCSANACCWQGKTASPCDSSGTSYSGCRRTVCTWYAADASCKALAYNGTKAGDWRLPTKDEMSKWKSNINTINKNQGDNGLRLCDDFSGYGAARCLNYGVCDGAINNHCYPYYVWSATTWGSNVYDFYLHSGTFYQNYNNFPRSADSVRCVLEGGGSTYNSYGGGGGSGASFFKNYQIPDDLIVNNIGGRIVFYAAPGAKGGNGASSSGTNASNGYSGTASYIALYDKTNKLIWGLEAAGGNGGKGASSSAGGNGGASVSNTSCKIFQNNVWTDTNCTGVGSAGSNGASLDTGGNSAANGGVGGGSLYNTTTLSGGGNGGSASSEVGGNGSLYGSGGGGGTTKFTTSGTSVTSTAGKGGYGANGVAEITYDLTYESAGGGGGGGGAMLKVENITVTPSTTYTIRVGGGGNGGAIMNNGVDGGESKVTFAGGTYVLSGGKGGKVGTSGTATTSAVHGVGGAGAAKSSVGVSVAGSNGSAGTISNIGSIGGSGGKSGIESEGGCGALFSNGVNCSATTTYGLSTMFVSPSNIFDAAEFGSAGAGGGGGGYAYNTTIYPDNNPGYGGNGQNGYVYIYWTEYD